MLKYSNTDVVSFNGNAVAKLSRIFLAFTPPPPLSLSQLSDYQIFTSVSGISKIWKGFFCGVPALCGATFFVTKYQNICQ
jgi:hypothetical protein